MDTVTTVDQSDRSVVSWGAVLAGGIASAALSLFLLALGAGIGFSIVSPWSDEGVSATTFHVTAGVYLVAISMLSSAVGGYLAGRLRAHWANVHNDEVYFRDTAHGLLAWAVALVLGVSALGAASTHIVAGASSGLAPAAGAVATTGQSGPTDILTDRLLRRDPASPTNASFDSSRDELGRLLTPTLRKRGGELSPADRGYVVRVISARTGLSEADAQKRLADVLAEAKVVADEARKAAAKVMLWTAAAMLAGAVAAMLGATEGGVLRDSKWYEPGWRAITVRNH